MRTVKIFSKVWVDYDIQITIFIYILPREARISKNIYIFDIYILKQSGRQMDGWIGRLQHAARSAAKKIMR